MTRKKEQ